MSYLEILINIFPKQIVTLFVAMLPVLELRGAIPLAMGALKMSAGEAYFFGVVGNILAGLFALLFLEYFVSFTMKRFAFCNVFFERLFAKTKKVHEYKFQYWGPLALVMFVAIPLPITGAWSGAVAAFVFRVPVKVSFLYISLGVLISGLIVTLISAGAINLVN